MEKIDKELGAELPINTNVSIDEMEIALNHMYNKIVHKTKMTIQGFKKAIRVLRFKKFYPYIKYSRKSFRRNNR